MATFSIIEHPYYKMPEILDAVGVTLEDARVVEGILTIDGVEQAVFDAAILPLDPLRGLRDIVIAKALRACTVAAQAGIPYQGFTIPTTQLDQMNLIGLSLASVHGQAHGNPFVSALWVLDSAQQWIRYEFNDAELIDMGLAVISHIQAQQEHYAEIRQQAEAATTAAQLLAITW